MGRLAEIRELTRVRVLSFFREPEAVFWVFVFPIVTALVLGFAFRGGAVESSPVGVVASVVDPAVVAALEARGDVAIETYETEDAARRALGRARIDALLGATDPGGGRLDVVIDPRRSEAALAELRVRAAMQEAAGIPPLALAREEVTEPGSRYVDFLLPGLVGMNLMGTGMWGIGFGIADARRRKFLKRLVVTPMRRTSFLLGYVNARLVFLVFEAGALVAFAMLGLGVPFRGDAASFAVLALLGAAAFAAISILVASRTRTIEGVSGLMNAVMVPMWLGSGVFFSYERFPEVVHPFLRLLPLTALNDGLRAIMLDGTSVFALLPEIGVLALWTIAPLAVALRIFRWQ